jgi:hypothetical protein
MSKVTGKSPEDDDLDISILPLTWRALKGRYGK